MVDCQDLLQRLNELKDGSDAATVEVPAGLLATTVEGLTELKEELQNAKDMLMMKPSMAKKLNEKIRLLEEEIAQLRAKNKVKEMEKKIQTLQAELKASYATKNFTLKSNLLELERKYQGALQHNPELAEMWNDVSHILGDDAKAVTPSYMSRSATFLRVGTMARPGAPLTHGNSHALDHVPETEQSEQTGVPEEAEPLSAVQAVKQKLQVRIEQASREAALSASNAPMPAPAPVEAPKKAPITVDAKATEFAVVADHTISVDSAKEQFTGAAPANVDYQASTSGHPPAVRPTLPPRESDGGASSISEQEETVTESLSALRTMYSNLAKEWAAQQGSGDSSAFSSKVQTIQSSVQQLQEVFKSHVFDAEAEQLLVSVEELRKAYEAKIVGSQGIDEQIEAVATKVEQLRIFLLAAQANGGAPQEQKSNAPPSLDVLRLDSIPDIDLLADAPGLAQADVDSLVSLFSTFTQELAEQHVLPSSAPSRVTNTPPASPALARHAAEHGTPSAHELVQYFKLYMSTHGASVLRKLLKQQEGMCGLQLPDTAQGEKPQLSSHLKEQSELQADADAAQSDSAKPQAPNAEPSAPSVVPALLAASASGLALHAESSPRPPAQTASLPPLSPSGPSLVAAAIADGPTPSIEAPSSMGKKTFSAVARAVQMLNNKYKTLLPDTPQTDALFSDLANMLENVIATHELKSHASKQIIARSLKQRGSGPPSVASLGNWDSVPAITPTGAAPESPFRDAGSDGMRTPRARAARNSAPEEAPIEEPAAESAAVQAAAAVETEAADMVHTANRAAVTTAPATTAADEAAPASSAGKAGEQPTFELLSPQITDKKVKELQNENEYLTRILIDAKVELADTKGEYMALLRALRKALSRESNARTKLEELERVVSVMAPGGPGVAALHEELSLRPIRTSQGNESQDVSESQQVSAQPSRTVSQEIEIQPP